MFDSWTGEILLLLVVNGVLELYLIVCPPVVIVVRQVTWFGLRPRAAVLFNLVFVAEASMQESVLRHEFAHIRQMRLLTPLGCAVFMFFHYGWLLCRHRSFLAVYIHSWLERQAFNAMNERGKLPRHLIVHFRQKKIVTHSV
jgi:hypothetical protein